MLTRLLLPGAGLVASMVAIARLDARRDTEWFLVLAGICCLCYLFTVWTITHAPSASRRGIWVCLAFAVLCRVPLLPVEPTLSDDIYRYVWDGRIQGLGLNPYVVVPADPAVASLHTDVTRKMNHPALPTLYPPVAEWVFRSIAAVSQSVFAFKLTFVGLDVLVIMLLLRWLSLAGHSPWRVLIYAWNPLVVLEIAGSGHLDAIGVALIVVSFLAFSRSAGAMAAVALAAAVGVKFVPVVLLPLFWRRIRPWHAALAVAFGLAAALPFASGAYGVPMGALPTYLAKWRFNGPLFGFIESIWRARWLTMLPAVAGVVVAAWFRLRSDPASPAAWAWPMGVALLLMPTVYPWYLLWLVPFLGGLETLPLLLWTQTSLVTYFVWRMSAAGLGWRLPAWAFVVELVPVAAAAAWMVLRSRGRVSEVH